MPAIARTANFPDTTLTRGMHLIIYHAWAQRPPQGRKFFRVFQSDQRREHTQTYGGLGVFDVKEEGEAVTYEAPVEGFTGTHTQVRYSKGIKITEDMWADDMYGIMEDSPAELGNMAYATEETILAAHFNNGFSSSYTGPDGKELFATDHVRENGASYSNELSSSADLSTTSLEQALIDYANFRDGGGKRLQIQPGVLLTSRDNMFNAMRILKSSYRPEDDTNAIQPVEGMGLKMEFWDYLTDTDAWFIGPKNKSDGYLIMYEHDPFTTDHVFDFDTGDIKYKGQFRFISGWGDPKAWYGSPGA